jgi:uncharacterized alkaline shock family protein YloU
VLPARVTGTGDRQMPETIPDGPTDPRLSAVEENTTIVSPGYGPPPDPPGMVPPQQQYQPGSPAAPFSRPLAPPIVPGPPGPVGSPIPPVTEEIRDAEPPIGGRVYGAGRPAGAPPPAPERTPELAERGNTTVSDEVIERTIAKIVDLTADEVAGVHGLYTGSDTEQPVTVTLDGSDATIEIAIRVEFGHVVHEVVERVRASVISQSERLLGLKITEVNVLVGDVAFDPAEAADAADSSEE